MKVYKNIDDFKGVRNAVVTIGKFDGVHLGHQKIISRLKEVAQAINGETVVLTFSPHPRIVLFPDDKELKLLNTSEEEIELLEKFGIDHLIIYPFTKEFSMLSSEEFVRKILVNSIQTKRLVVGYNHHFGRNREGGLELLKSCGLEFGFEVEEVSKTDIDSIEISSTKIRNNLLAGEVTRANTLLGHLYSLTGKVIRGKEIGRNIGFPTLNLLLEDAYKLIPKDGVYVVYVKYKELMYHGMLNIGNNPTIEGKGRSMEVNVFDFDKEIYGENVTIYFIERLRDEKKFSNLEELKTQLAKDKADTLLILKK